MLVQEKNIKGFNLLELIVVIVIVGIISATAYPNFSKWKKEREVRQGAAKIQSLIKNINAQIERGTFAFVQVLIRRTNNALTVQSKGMTMQNLATRMNDGSSGWNANSDERCPVSPTSPYWDTDATDPGDIGNYVYENLKSHKILIAPPQGAFYLMPEFKNKKYKTSSKLCDCLLYTSDAADD